MTNSLPKLPPGFEPAPTEAPQWWKDLYGPTEDGDPIEVDWVDTDPRFS